MKKLTASQIKRMSVKNIEMNITSSKHFISVYEKDLSNQKLDRIETKETYQALSYHQAIVGDLSKELYVRQMMKGGK